MYFQFKQFKKIIFAYNLKPPFKMLKTGPKTNIDSKKTSLKLKFLGKILKKNKKEKPSPNYNEMVNNFELKIKKSS